MSPRVLHYMPAFSSPSQTFLYDLVCGVAELGIDSAVATRRRVLADERPFDPVFIVKNRNPIKRLYGLLADPEHLKLRNTKGIKQLINSWRPNILHAHTGIAGIRLSQAMDKERIQLPLVVSFHGNDVSDNPFRIKGYRQHLEALLQRPGTHFIAPSRFLQERLIVRHHASTDNCQVIPNAVNPRFLTAQKKMNKGGHEITVVCNGRLTEVKGHVYLLHAFKEVLHKNVNAQLVLVGHGELEDSLVQLSYELGVAEKVTFAGYIPHREMVAVLQKADLYVQPSVVSKRNEEESFGVAALEACAAGLPVIVTRSGGLPSLLPEDVSVVVEPANSKDLAEAILELMCNEEKRLAYAENCRANVLKRFTREIVYPKYVELYRTMLAGDEK